MENRVFRGENRYSWSTQVTRRLSGYDFSQFKFVESIKKHHFMAFFQQNLVKSRFFRILILPIFRQKMTFWVDFMNWNGQQSSPDSIFVIRVLRNKDTALKTHGLQLKKPNFQNNASTDITTNRSKKWCFWQILWVVMVRNHPVMIFLSPEITYAAYILHFHGF